ncbi:helix-turn-helix domain-containing protein [Candidatus Enterococcus mansonii]|uniref:Mga helix-turn-helix domain-containing protein n=1 Tax=Candidatus Enterococcus mansonii TaxID=1834181 RepID=A0ABU8IJ65_9ENTE
MEFFLTDKNKKKLELFKELVFKEGEAVSFTYLQDFLDISLSTLKRYFNELEGDIKKNEELKNIYFKKNTGSYQLVNHSNFDIDYLFIHLRIYYLKDSLQFKIISEILDKNYATADELADKLFVSVPYLYKQITTLNDQLSQFHLKIVFHSKENLCGDEKHLRMFFFYFYWNTSRGIAFPIELKLSNFLSNSIMTQELEMKYSPSTIKRLKLILGIATLRQFKFPIHLSDKEKEVLKPFKLSGGLFGIGEKHLRSEDEQLFFELMVRSFISDIDTSEEKLLLYKSFSRTNSIVHSCDLLVLEYEKHFFARNPINQNARVNIFYHLLITLLHCSMFSINPLLYLHSELPYDPNEFDSMKEHTPDLSNVSHFYKDFSIQNPEFDLAPSFNLGICMLLTILTDMFVVPTMTIYIEYSGNNLGSNFIKNRLLMLFNPQTIRFTTNIMDAQIVITDYFEVHGFRDNQKFFFMDSFLDKRTWYDLTLFIHSTLFSND